MKKREQLRYWFIFFVILSALTLLVSCGGSGGGGGGGTGTGGDSETPAAKDNIAGTIYDDAGNNVGNTATVTVFSTVVSTKTDTTGKYSLSAAEGEHVMLVENPGWRDSFRIVNAPNPNATSVTPIDVPFMLQSRSPDLPAPVSIVTGSGAKIVNSNTINGNKATLNIPNQTSFTVNGVSQGIVENLILEYIDIHDPISVPLPSQNNRQSSSGISIDRQAPSVIVSIKPARLVLSSNATLTLPNPDGLTTERILRFDHETHKWIDTGIKAGNTVSIKYGGIYGIFFETLKMGSVIGTATAGSTVLIGDLSTQVPSSGNFTIDQVPVPSTGDLNVKIFNSSATPKIQNKTVTPVIGGTAVVGSQGGGGTVSEIRVVSTSPATSAPASGNDIIQVTFKAEDSEDVPVAGQIVTFSASGSLGGSPVISPDSDTTDSNGQVKVSVSDTKAENVTVTATSAGKSGQQLLTFTPLPPASIVLVSSTPSPAVISIAGVGSTSSATLNFRVVDVNNNPVVGSHIVNFSILQGGLNGGEELTMVQSSTVSSMVSTTLNSGSKAGSLQIGASLNDNPNILTYVTITITGGLPSGNAIGISANPLNIEGLKEHGLTQTLRISAADFYSNPVAPGVQAQFQTDYANVTGSAIFVSSGNASVATAVVTSGDPDPVDGLLTASAQTIGGLHSKVLALAVDPQDENIIFAGTDGGGIFKTINAGSSWQQVGSPFQDQGSSKVANLTGSVVRDIIVDSNNSDVIYAGTDKGFFVSKNGGQNWSSLTGIRRITGDNLGAIPADSKFGTNGLAARLVDSNTDGETTAFGYVFTSAGSTFVTDGVAPGDFIEITGGDDAGNYTITSVDSETQLTLYNSLTTTATGVPFEITRKLFFAFNSDHNWNRARTTIKLDGDEITDYFLDVSDATGETGICIFGIPGAGLTEGDIVSADYDSSPSSELLGNKIYAIAVNPSPGNFDSNLGQAKEIYAGTYGAGIWKTEDGGRKWKKASTMAANSGVSFGPKILSMEINPLKPAEILAGTDGDGLFITTDGAKTWTKLVGTLAGGMINETVVQDVIAAPDLAGIQNIWIAGKNGIHYSIDAGSTWLAPSIKVNANDSTNTDVRVLARDDNDGTLYAATFGDVLGRSAPAGGVYSSTDNGATWAKLTNISTSAGAHAIDALAVAGKSGDDTVIVGSEGRSVARSANSGTTWSIINGSGSSALTNTLFTTINLMHSGTAQIEIIPLSSSTQGYGNFEFMAVGETHYFYIRISDENGNRLTPGTSITFSKTAGELSVSSSPFTLPDGIYGGVDYYIAWSNSKDPAAAAAAASLTVAVSANAETKTLPISKMLD